MPHTADRNMPPRSTRLLGLLMALVLAAVLVGAPDPSAAATAPVRLPAAGELLQASVDVHARPDPGSPVTRRQHEFGPDSQFEIVLAIAARLAPDGHWWYELSLPGRPNGRRGWVRGDLLDLRPVRNRIVVEVNARRLEVRRISDGRLLLRAVVAVGKQGTETPIGSDFFVRSRSIPDDPFFGMFVLETTAYSSLPDWPGGGPVGIHGTDRPALLGQAVSHGCVRVSNRIALALERLAPLGTVIDFVR